MKHTIHVHQQKIRQDEPAIIDRTYKGSTHHRSVGVTCPACGTIAGTFLQLDEPDACGARVVFTTVATTIGSRPGDPF